MKKKYFGQYCKYFIGKWEDEYIAREAGIDITQWTPVLTYCNHPENKLNEEGNCHEKFCPLKLKKEVV